jgi:two-component system, cell cycle sensor histidine kinase and response regulator CckA
MLHATAAGPWLAFVLCVAPVWAAPAPAGAPTTKTPNHLVAPRDQVIVLSASAAAVMAATILLLVRADRRRRRSEQELRASESRLRTFLDTLPDQAWVKDRQMRYLAVNQAYCDLNGVERDHIIGRTAAAFIPPGRLEAIHAADEEAMRTGQVVRVDSSVVGLDGVPRWFETVKAPLRDAAGAIVGTAGVARDITARKKAEEALRESVAKYRTLVETADDVILVTDTDGGHVFRNGAYYRTLGYDPNDAGAPQGTDHVHPDDRAALAGHRDEMLARGSLTSEYRVRHRDGRWLDWVAKSTVMYDENRKPYGILSVIRDATETRRIEAEKVRLEADLRQMQKIESIGRLAGGVAHDINNLLSPILGYSELLLSEASLDDDARRGAREIKHAAERARDLTRQLLAFSRKQILSLEPVDLGRVLADFQPLLRRTIREDIRIIIHTLGGLSTVRADVGQIQQVIMNLSVNAQDAMPDGGEITIALADTSLDNEFVRAHEGAVAGDYVLLSVADTGCGMDATTRDHLFEPFFTTKANGTGLGLSTAFGIVKQHGGSIWVESETGQGTTFRIYLPRIAAAAAAASPAGPAVPSAPPAASTAASAPPAGSETILVVEDMPAVRRLAQTVLTRHGYQVTAVENGEQALALMSAARGPVDLVLTDVVMPGINGRELCSRLSAMWPGIKVVYMSGHSEDVIAHHGVLDEGVFFIQKPFGVDALLAKVRAALAARAAPAAER